MRRRNLTLILGLVVLGIIVTNGSPISQLGFTPSGWMGDWSDINFNDRPDEEPGALKISYYPHGQSGWAGLYWLYPSSNWGDLPGKDLENYNFDQLNFSARGMEGGERVEFLVGGVNTGKPFSDSIQPARSITKDLSTDWTEYSIPVGDLDLRNVIGGFGWIIDTRNGGRQSTFYIKNIEYIN